jgi:membrane protease YdiL (CAAX protease family)
MKMIAIKILISTFTCAAYLALLELVAIISEKLISAIQMDSKSATEAFIMLTTYVIMLTTVIISRKILIHYNIISVSTLTKCTKDSTPKYAIIGILLYWLMSTEIVFLLSVISYIFNLGLKKPMEINSDISLGISGTPIFFIIVFSFAVCVIGPIAEELFFRGILFRIFIRKGFGETRRNVVIGIITSSALFGIAHLDITQGTTAFFGGVLLSTLYYMSGKILVPIICHMTNNTLTTVIPFIFETSMHSKAVDASELLIGGVMFIIVAPLIVLLVKKLISIYKNERHDLRT